MRNPALWLELAVLPIITPPNIVKTTRQDGHNSLCLPINAASTEEVNYTIH